MSSHSSSKTLPTKGHDPQAILDTMRALRRDDADWHEGKVWALVYHAGDEIAAFLKEAHGTFFSENALNPSAFPSLKQMEMEVVAMTASLLGGDEQVVGSMTSGGTESIMMAVKAAREWGKARGIKRPKMVLPSSAHPAFPKAAHYFDVEPIWVPVGDDFRADVKAMRRAITRDTVLIVGSAPSYPQGIVDPIEELAKIAKKKKILMHVDACVGGFMLPFVRATGRDVPPFDLSIDGVTSMSVDLHKYAYAAKGASVILFRDAELRKHMYYAYTDWSGGIYASPTMGGTRPGGVIAAAWAILQRLGFEGYTEIARQVMDTTDILRTGIEAIDGVEVLGDPKMSILAIGSQSRDIYAIADELTAKGWHVDRQQNPASFHLTVNHAHVQSAPQLLEDLRQAVLRSPRFTRQQLLAEQAKRIALKTAVTLLPGAVVTKATQVASDVMGLASGDGSLPERSAPMYGLIATLPNRGDLHAFIIDTLDRMMRFDPAKEIVITPAKEAPGEEVTEAAPEAPSPARTPAAPAPTAQAPDAPQPEADLPKPPSTDKRRSKRHTKRAAKSGAPRNEPRSRQASNATREPRKTTSKTTQGDGAE